MKKIIAIITIAAAGFASCKSSEDKQKEAALEQQVQEMRMQHVMDSMNAASKLQVNMPTPIPEQTVATTTNTSSTQSSPKVVYRTHTVVKHVPVHHYHNYASSPARGYYGDQYAGYQQQPVQQKRGWSAKAKGAAIGAGAGALTGALVGHNRGTGALIGGAIGAAAGLGTGAIIDHKNGRNQR